MPKSWSRRERREHAAERYHERRKIFYTLLMLLVMLVLLIYGIVYSIQTGNFTLAGILILVLIIGVPIGIFLTDMATWESH